MTADPAGPRIICRARRCRLVVRPPEVFCCACWGALSPETRKRLGSAWLAQLPATDALAWTDLVRDAVDELDAKRESRRQKRAEG